MTSSYLAIQIINDDKAHIKAYWNVDKNICDTCEILQTLKRDK